MQDRDSRIATANAALATFTRDPGTRIVVEPTGHLAVEWLGFRSQAYLRKRWILMRGSSHYPVWHHRAPWGGTQSTALSFLIRWIQGKPVYGLASWAYWSSDTVKLCNEQTVEVLRAGGYPERSHCVLCGAEGCGDWWDLDGVTGPCCRYGKCQREAFEQSLKFR